MLSAASFALPGPLGANAGGLGVEGRRWSISDDWAGRILGTNPIAAEFDRGKVALVRIGNVETDSTSRFDEALQHVLASCLRFEAERGRAGAVLARHGQMRISSMSAQQPATTHGSTRVDLALAATESMRPWPALRRSIAHAGTCRTEPSPAIVCTHLPMVGIPQFFA